MQLINIPLSCDSHSFTGSLHNLFTPHTLMIIIQLCADSLVLASILSNCLSYTIVSAFSSPSPPFISANSCMCHYQVGAIDKPNLSSVILTPLRLRTSTTRIASCCRVIAYGPLGGHPDTLSDRVPLFIAMGESRSCLILLADESHTEPIVRTPQIKEGSKVSERGGYVPNWTIRDIIFAL